MKLLFEAVYLTAAFVILGVAIAALASKYFPLVCS